LAVRGHDWSERVRMRCMLRGGCRFDGEVGMTIQDEQLLEIAPMGVAENGRLRFGVTSPYQPGQVAIVTVPGNVPSPEMFADIIARAHLAELDWKPIPAPRRPE